MVYDANMENEESMKALNKKYIFGAITILWVGVIFFFSLQPGEVSSDISGSFGRKLLELFLPSVFEKLEAMSQEQLDMWHLILRKCAHFTEFFILGVLSTYTMRQTKVPHKVMIAFIFCVAVAASDETIQLFVSERAGRVQDVLLDSTGALCGISLVSFWGKLRGK